MKTTLYTIGYATKEIDAFIELLKKHGITCLIDVRTSPFSKAFPDFDKNALKAKLNKNNILYAHFGEEFGARRSEYEAYSITYSLKGERKDQVDFQKVYNLPVFQKGVERVFNALRQNYTVCLMCSEKHPVDCHRFWMVGYYFANLSYPLEIINIISEDETQSYQDVLNSVELNKEKQKFYKEHDELNENGLLAGQFEIPDYVQYWDELFSSESSNKEQKYSNIRIGYVKGEDNNG